MGALPDVVLPHVGKLLRLVGSPIDGECLASARALGRVLHANGSDWHDLAERIEHPPAVYRDARADAGHGRRPLKWNSANRQAVVAALRAGIEVDAFTQWEHEFAASTITILGQVHGKLSPKQAAIVDRLLAKVREARR